MDFANVNYLAVGVAAIASFGLGALWYSGPLFMKSWQKELGFTDEYLQGGNMAKIFGTSFVMMLLMALGMGLMIQGHGPSDTMNWSQGLQHGLFVGLLFVATSMAINVLYQRRSLKLWLIDSGYQVLFLAVQGAIIGAWPK